MYFVCHTVYHVYVSLMMQLTQPVPHCGIMLTDNIPNVDVLVQRLKRENIFDEVICFHHKDAFPAFTKRSFHLTYACGLLFMHRVHKKLSFLLKEDRIYLYTDYSNIGAYLMQNKKRYHLLEDGCDTFTHDVHHVSGRQKKIKQWLHKYLDIPYSIGMSACCIDITVNDKSRVKTPFSFPVLEMNKAELVSRLRTEDVERILRCFDINLSMGKGKNLLLITQPMTEMYLCKTNEEAVRFFEEKLEQFKDEYQIYIKPHPRDEADYTNMFGGDVTVIDRTVPIEILNFKKDVLFDLGVFYTSTSVNSLICCKEVRRIE